VPHQPDHLHAVQPSDAPRTHRVRTHHRPLAIGAAVVGMLAGLLAAVGPAGAAANMVTNGGLSAGTGNTFDCFDLAGWGTNTATLAAVTGTDGTGRAARLTMSGRQSGDRKLIIRENDACGVAVTAGTSYDLYVSYTSTVPVEGAFYRKTAAGWTWWYVPGNQLPAASTWTRARFRTPAVPADTVRVAWGVAIAANGTLITDDYAQVPAGQPVDSSSPTPTPTVTATPTASPSPTPSTVSPTPTVTSGPTTTAPAAGAENLVPNGALATGTSTPTCFATSGWGTHTVTQGLSADVPTGASGRSWAISISNWRSGDRKLLTSEAAGCSPAVTPGSVYTATIWYRSSRPVNGSFFRHTAGGWQGWYVPNATFPATADWTKATVVLPAMPVGTDLLSFGLSIDGDGTLSTTGYSLVRDTSGDVPAGSTEATLGKWTVSAQDMPLRALHATLLTDGRVLLVAGSGNDPARLTGKDLRTSVWDPRTNTFTDVPTPADLFCMGHVTLPDGRILVAGGTSNYVGQNGATGYEGIADSYIFDPATTSYTRINDMVDAHWYPTLTKLGNGDVWAAGGLDEMGDGTVLIEMYSAARQAWMAQSEVPQWWRYWGLYPHMFLMQDGRLFYSGAHTFGLNLPGTGASVHDWRTGATLDIPGLRDKDLRDQAGSVILPPAQNQTVMIVGGGYTDINAKATRTVDIVDLNAASPAYTPGPDLPGTGKSYVNLTTLPDRTVLATNGATNNRSGDVLTAAVFQPQSRTWTTVAPDPVPRNYHSVSILLPDGRVAVFGSNPADGSFELRVSVYQPSYFFRGTRPTVAAPAAATYGQQIQLGVSGTVVSAALTSPRSATHQTDTNERLVDLPITGTGSARIATVPTNRNLLPPGPHLLTVLDADGLPSTATWISIR